MAVDAKIELFACELFNALWKEYFFGHIEIPFEIIRDCEVPLESEMNDDILKAVKCRRSIFYLLLSVNFHRHYEYFCTSASDFYAYLRKSFPYAVFQNKTVMEEVIASCAYVAEMCLYAASRGNYHFVYKCHLVWAMYFDTELKHRFYAEGGWSALKRVAQPYILCYDFLKEHYDKYTPKYDTSFSLWPVGKNVAAVEEFAQFSHDALTLNNGMTMSTKFIYHCVVDNDQPLPKTSMVSSTCEASCLTIYGVENLLQYMKYMCDSNLTKIIEYDRKIALGEVRVFYDPKTSKKFIFDEKQSKALENEYTKFLSDISDKSESPVKEQKISDGKDCLEGINTLTSSVSPLNNKNMINSKNPINAVYEDDLQNNLEFIFSELDINSTAPENTVSPNQYLPAIPGQENAQKPTRKRVSGGKENFHSQTPLFRNLASKCTPAKKVVLPQRKMVNYAKKGKTRRTTDKATRSLTSIEAKLQPNYEIDGFIKESSTKVNQATKFRSIENKTSSSLDEVTLTTNKIGPDQIDKIASTVPKTCPNPNEGNCETGIKVSQETKSSNETQTSAEKQSESVAYHVKDILRMMLVLGSPPGIRFIRSTLHNSNKKNGKIRSTDKIFL